MKILFTTPVLEHPPAGGSQLRIENTLKALARCSELYLVPRVSQRVMGGQAAEDFYRGLSQGYSAAPSSHGLHSNRYINKLQRVLRDVTGSATKADAAHIIRCADEWGAEVIWFGYGNISYPLMCEIKRRRPELKLVCDTDSVWSRFVLREVPLEKNPLRRALLTRRGHQKEREERDWVEMCDVTTGVSEVDCAYYRSLTGKAHKVQQLSNVIDLDTYAQKVPPAADLKTPCVYLAGKYGHVNSPMDRAARWMLDHVMPLVWAQKPEAHFYIVGKDSDRTLGHETNERVTVTGMLPAVLPYLMHVDVSVVPLQYESGTRFKILEAAACDIPIVSTTLGAEGLPVEDGKDILIADAPQPFAEAILRILDDPARGKALAASCRDVVQQGYSIDTLVREAKHIMERLAA